MATANQYFYVRNVTVPYVGDMTKQLDLGCKLYINGFMKYKAHIARFKFISQDGDSEEDTDLALSLKVDFLKRRFYRSCSFRDQDRIIKEELGQFPFTESEKFEIIIIFELNRFKIVVDQLNIFYFTPFKMATDKIIKLTVDGDVDIYKMQVLQNLGPKLFELRDLALPFACKLPPFVENAKMRMLIEIPIPISRFEIDIQRGAECMPKDIALHLNPRWDDPKIPNEPFMIILNHRSSSKWGNEDRYNMNHILKTDESNEIIISYTKTEWRIHINGVYLCDFKHRLSMSYADHIFICGPNIKLRLFEFVQPWAHLDMTPIASRAETN